MPVSVNLNNGLDKAYEDKTLDEILSAPPSALAGVTDKDAELLNEALGIQTARDFGSNKHSRWPASSSRCPARSADGQPTPAPTSNPHGTPARRCLVRDAAVP